HRRRRQDRGAQPFPLAAGEAARGAAQAHRAASRRLAPRHWNSEAQSEVRSVGARLAEGHSGEAECAEVDGACVVNLVGEVLHPQRGRQAPARGAEIDAASGAHRSPSARLVMKAIPGRTPIDTKAISELERRLETVRPGIAKIAAGPGAKGDSAQPVFLISQILSPQRDSQSGVAS